MQFGTIMRADNLPRIKSFLFEKNYQYIIVAANPHFTKVQAYLLDNHKISGSMPIRSQLF